MYFSLENSRLPILPLMIFFAAYLAVFVIMLAPKGYFLSPPGCPPP